MDAAVRLGPLADWTQAGSALRLLPGLERKVYALARALDCYWLTFGGRQVSDDELAEAEGS
jgi:hypothetical protein